MFLCTFCVLFLIWYSGSEKKFIFGVVLKTKYKRKEKKGCLVRELLANDSLRESIAQNAYIKASKEHIWDNRAESILRGL